ncbi:MAG: flagellar biosynthetic protein FliO [Pseudomonadota bacterium]
MKLSIRLSVGSHKKTFTFASERILLVVFSVIIAMLVTMDKVRADDNLGEKVAVENMATVILDAPASQTSQQTPSPIAVATPVDMRNKTIVTSEPKKINSASQLASLVGGLMLILGLIYGLSWFVKRFSQGGFMQNSTIKMLSALPLGARERIMLVDVGGKQILLGITATTINALHVFAEPVVNAPQNATPAASDFSQKLMAILQKDVVQNDTAQQKDLGNSTSSNLKNSKK